MSAVDGWAGLALAVLALALLAWAAVAKPGGAHARVTREGGTVFLGERVMQFGYRGIDALAGWAVRRGLGADTVSWLSLGLGLAAGVAAALGELGLAAWGLALSGLGDGLDGAIARRTGTSSPGGAVLDSALDRYVEFFFLAGLVVFFAGAPWRQLAVVTALFGGFMVTYSTAKAEALHVTPPRGWMKRAERMVWLAGGATVAAAGRCFGQPAGNVMLAAVLLVAVFANASAVRRLAALARATDARD